MQSEGECRAQHVRVCVCALVPVCSCLRVQLHSTHLQILTALPITLAQSLALRTFILDSISTPVDTYILIMF
jgi:hypothetical protein